LRRFSAQRYRLTLTAAAELVRVHLFAPEVRNLTWVWTTSGLLSQSAIPRHRSRNRHTIYD
jgi:hypothetical protein